jgi:hypothetical protein
LPSENEIYVLGKALVDTDEFDSHVIVHEWGHYFDANLARSDSPGGRHGPGDVLDPRIAFGEAWGNAVASMETPRRSRMAFWYSVRLRRRKVSVRPGLGAAAARRSRAAWSSETAVT